VTAWYTARSLISEVVSPASIFTRSSSGISEPEAQIEPTRSTGDRVLEKLPTRITRRRPSIAASEASPRGGQFAVDVVLHQPEIELLGQRQQAVRLRLRQRGAERILQHRVDEHELGLGLRRLLRQRVEIQALVAARDADRDAAVVAYQRQQVAVAGILDEHGVARLGQGAQDQVEGVGGAVGQQDLLRLDGEQLVGQLADMCWRSVGKPSGWP
jgi:hypothetical protein